MFKQSHQNVKMQFPKELVDELWERLPDGYLENYLDRVDIIKWVAALRSGDYKQGYDSLRQITSTGRSFCCLGVYKEVCIKTFDSSLPYALLHEKLDKENCADFIKMNDSRQMSFEQIADVIEERYASTDS